MHRLTISLFSVLFFLSPLSSSVPNAHPHPAPSQIDLDVFLSLTPLIVPDPPPPDVLADLAEQAKSNNLSESLPTPIADQYPDQLTGSLNCSYFVIPISYKEARAIIPAQYPILTNQIKQAWKDHNKHKHKHAYPLVLSVQLDHDISIFDAAIPDFNLVAFRFPFIDLLGDGRSSFTYLPTDLLSNTTLGVSASKIYGIDAIVSNFTPFRDPYAYVPGAKAKGPRFVNAIPVEKGTGEGFRAEFEDRGKLSSEDFDFFKAVLNQPFFGNPTSPTPVTCGYQYKFYDTVTTTGKYAPVEIKGPVSLEGGVVKEFPKGFDLKKAKGARFDVAFLEKNYLNCSQQA